MTRAGRNLNDTRNIRRKSGGDRNQKSHLKVLSLPNCLLLSVNYKLPWKYLRNICVLYHRKKYLLN